MKVCFETFGCRLNRAEALQEEAEYLARGWEPTDSHADAQLIVVRGCSVTARAQRDCERLVEHIRRKYPFKRVIETGCLPSAKKDYFLKKPGSSRIGPGSNRVGLGSARVNVDPSPTPSAPNSPLNAPIPTLDDPIPTRTARAYLKIQDGCSGHCTFCIVPKFRGPSVSIPFDDVLARARAFIDAGYREIVMTGCSMTQYLSDGKRLPELVSAIAELDGPHRVRLGSIEPGSIALETVSAMASHTNVCRNLHITVQSGSTRILSAMRRPYGAREIEELVSAASKAMPRLGLGCDLMTGFPDEQFNDHIATLGLLKRLPFTKAHVFPYSERPGTVAAALPNSVPENVRVSRARELAQMADAKRTDFAKRFRGKDVEIVVEDEKHCAGWTSEYLWCRCDGVGARKSLKKIRVVESEEHQLRGKPV